MIDMHNTWSSDGIGGTGLPALGGTGAGTGGVGSGYQPVNKHGLTEA